MTTTEWQIAFRQTSLATGFRLALTQSMLEYLCAVSDNTRWNRFWDMLNGNDKLGAGHATAGALERRGLIADRFKASDSFPNLIRGTLNGGMPDLESRYELTPAGRLVVELVLLTGLFVESDASHERKVARSIKRARR